MQQPANGRRRKARMIWITMLLLFSVAVGFFGYHYWNQASAMQASEAQAQSAAQRVLTKQLRTGSITLATSGSVTLVASQESSLAFTVSGTVAELNAVVGGQVKKGQVLAQLDTLDELQTDFQTAGLDLLSAQKELDAFAAKAPANLANAQRKVIQAQEAFADAQNKVVEKDTVRCDQDTRDALLIKYNRAVDQLTALGDGGGNEDYYLNTILPQKQKVDQALGAYQACAGFTDYQVASSQAGLSLAQAKLKLAQDALDTLTKNNGLDPSEQATAENKVATAQQALDTAKEDLEGATLKAPFDGTILSVAGKAGDTIETTSQVTSVAFITIADLAHPLLQFSIDETDLSMVATGEAAAVIFDGFPNRTFHGTVIRVDPALSSKDGSSYVTGLIQLDLSQETDVPAFPKNLSGSVQIIQATAENVLLIPVEALHKQGGGAYGVYVMGADGQPTLKTVEVGLMDVASAEIKSGLNAGDIVITSDVQ